MLQRKGFHYGAPTPFHRKLSFQIRVHNGALAECLQFCGHVADGSGSTFLILFGGAGRFGGVALFTRIAGRILLNPH
ncbi:hypothetical protein IF803_37385 [Bradyrhizobium sp. UFLA06-06]